MLHRGTGVGLDIGTRKIKLASVKKMGAQIRLMQYGEIPTPEGSVDAGNILEPETVGRCVQKLTSQLGLEGSKVFSAVSGQQIYIKNLVMPFMKTGELKEAAIFQAAEFLPIPIEEAAIDIFPFRHFEDDEGRKTEVFFAAARRQQVELLAEVCHDAGLRLAAVEIEPLAIYRTLELTAKDKIVGILNIGASRSQFSVFKTGLLSFLRSLSFGCSAFYQNIKGKTFKEDIHLEEIEAGEGSDYSYLVRDIMSELARSLEYYEMQNEGEAIERIFLCGGGSRLRNLDTYLTSGIGRTVKILDYTPPLWLPEGIAFSERQTLQHDFTIAMGLAVRGVV